MNDGDHEVNADGDPDLRLHRVGACSSVVLDAQMAFDPAEEQLGNPPKGKASKADRPWDPESAREHNGPYLCMRSISTALSEI